MFIEFERMRSVQSSYGLMRDCEKRKLGPAGTHG